MSDSSQSLYDVLPNQVKIIPTSTSVTLQTTLSYAIFAKMTFWTKFVQPISTGDRVQQKHKFSTACVKQSHHVFSMCSNISHHDVYKHTQMCLLFHVLCYQEAIFILRYVAHLSVTRLKWFGVDLVYFTIILFQSKITHNFFIEVGSFLS